MLFSLKLHWLGLGKQISCEIFLRRTQTGRVELPTDSTRVQKLFYLQVVLCNFLLKLLDLVQFDIKRLLSSLGFPQFRLIRLLQLFHRILLLDHELGWPCGLRQRAAGGIYWDGRSWVVQRSHKDHLRSNGSNIKTLIVDADALGRDSSLWGLHLYHWLSKADLRSLLEDRLRGCLDDRLARAHERSLGGLIEYGFSSQLDAFRALGVEIMRSSRRGMIFLRGGLNIFEGRDQFDLGAGVRRSPSGVSHS